MEIKNLKFRRFGDNWRKILKKSGIFLSIVAISCAPFLLNFDPAQAVIKNRAQLSLENQEIRANSPDSTHISFDFTTWALAVMSSDDSQSAKSVAIAIPKNIKNVKVSVSGIHSPFIGNEVFETDIPVLLKNMSNMESGSKGIDSGKITTDKGKQTIQFAPWNIGGELWLDYIAHNNLNQNNQIVVDEDGKISGIENYWQAEFAYGDKYKGFASFESSSKNENLEFLQDWANNRQADQIIEAEFYQTGGGIDILANEIISSSLSSSFNLVAQNFGNRDVFKTFRDEIEHAVYLYDSNFDFHEYISDSEEPYVVYNPDTGELELTEAGQQNAKVESAFHNATDYNFIVFDNMPESRDLNITYRIEGDVATGEETYLPVRALPASLHCLLEVCDSLAEYYDWGRFGNLPRYNTASAQQELIANKVGDDGFDTPMCRANKNGLDARRDAGGDVNSRAVDWGTKYYETFNLRLNPAVNYTVAGYQLGDDGCEQALIHILPYEKENSQNPLKNRENSRENSLNNPRENSAPKFKLLAPNSGKK